MKIGIQAMEAYFPNTYVDQADLQKHYGVSQGKYTKGLGQFQLSFAYPLQDANSLSLTVLNRLLKNNNIQPSQVGRLQVGTETLLDKSKSTKTVLMSLFQGFHDIEGATSINACYGATNALFNTLNWMGSPSWDGRYGIVIATDVAVYQQGPARPTGGAGAIAMLISKNPKISFNPIRASFIDHQYDFYKPIPGSQYPIVDGKLSQECYLKALVECYTKLKQKNHGKNLIENVDHVLFHTPYTKMVQKAYNSLVRLEKPSANPEEIQKKFINQVQESLYISKRVGNIYTGSLYGCLFSLLYRNQKIRNKKLLFFSYGSGLCASMFEAQIHSNPLRENQIQQTTKFFANRIKISPKQYTEVMLLKQKNFGVFRGKINGNLDNLEDNTYYLENIDQKWRRSYKIKCPLNSGLTKNNVNAVERIQILIDKRLVREDMSKFYKMNIPERREILQGMVNQEINEQTLNSGGLNLQMADSMIENVVGMLSLPLGVIPSININKKKYTVPMVIQEPSVVAAASSIGKFISPYSFQASSTPSIMIAQVHLPSIEHAEANQILKKKSKIIQQLNKLCPKMVEREGGVKDLRIRDVTSQKLKGGKSCSLDVMVGVCQAMGANITNTIAQKAKQIVGRMGINTGISVLSNYCLERMTVSSFTIPVQHMTWKGVSGLEVAKKILQAYEFARSDVFRAVTHNKGIMNGVDAVCLATGQDWRAVQSAAHAYAAKNGKYQPLTHYEIFQKEGNKYFKGILQLPITVGTVGGAINRNQIYRTSLNILGNPSTNQLAEIIVTVGLAQNFAALRALAIEGIQRGHMKLHARAIALKSGCPNHLLQECCKYMEQRKRYDESTVIKFVEFNTKPKL